MPDQSSELAGYPMPGGKKTPLKIDGTEIKYVVVVPKGYTGEYPTQASELAGYPMPGAKDKPTKIDGTEIKYVVVVPKGYTGEYPTKASASEVTEIVEAYPMPGAKDKPMKIDGAALEYVVLAPKGYHGQYPAAEAHAGETQEKSEVSSVNEEKEKLTDERDYFKQQYENLLAERRSELSNRIVTLKKEDGVIEEKEVETLAKELGQLDETALRVILADTQRVHAKITKQPEEGTSKVKFSGSSLSEEQTLRQKLFGHANPPGEK